MSANIDNHQQRVNVFCDDLVNLKTTEFIRKYITTGTPVMIAETDYFTLRNQIADEFSLHPSAVILVGSTRTGFSIKPKKRYLEARPNSDLDVAIVSPERFDDYWDRVFEYAESDAAWRRSPQYYAFRRSLFYGWIDPRDLPSVHTFEKARHWVSVFDALMQSRRFGTRRISARLYRNWSRLEAYQERAVRQCIADRGVASDE